MTMDMTAMFLLGLLFGGTLGAAAVCIVVAADDRRWRR